MARKSRVEDRLAEVLAGGGSRRRRAQKAPLKARSPSRGGDGKPNILVTGVATYWGERLALHLEKDTHFGEVHGIDVDRPRVGFRRTKFTHLDIRSPMIVDFLISRKIDVVVHLQVAEGADAETSFRRNVMDFMVLLSACGDAGVRQFVLMSEIAVYGHSPDNPVAIKESRYLQKKQAHFLDRSMGQNPHLQNLLEIEKYVFQYRDGNQGEGEQGMRILPLRFAPIVGPRANTWMTRYLREPIIPTALGFDPLIQLIHEDDVVRALYKGAISDVDGPVNVAAEGLMTLHQLIRRMGRTWVPFAHSVGNLWRTVRSNFTGEKLAPLGMASLKFNCTGDLQRMREELDFEPRMTVGEALLNFSEHRRMARYYHEAEPEALYGTFTENALKAILADGSLGMEDA